MTQLNYILLMASQGKDNPYQMFIMMGLIIVVFYFFMIRPQVKKQKDLRKFREELKRGDKIITIGGIHGKILDVEETTVTIEVEDKMRLKVEKSGLIKDATGMIGQK